MKIKVYLAGGFRTRWQDKIKYKFADKFIFLDPLTHNLIEGKEYTCWDTFFIKKCDLLFAYMERSNPSGYGLTYEIGYARALQKTIILVDEKSDSDENFKKYFQIVSNSVDVLYHSFEDGLNFLEKFSIPID